MARWVPRQQQDRTGTACTKELQFSRRDWIYDLVKGPAWVAGYIVAPKNYRSDCDSVFSLSCTGANPWGGSLCARHHYCFEELQKLGESPGNNGLRSACIWSAHIVSSYYFSSYFFFLLLLLLFLLFFFYLFFPPPHPPCSPPSSFFQRLWHLTSVLKCLGILCRR